MPKRKNSLNIEPAVSASVAAELRRLRRRDTLLFAVGSACNSDDAAGPELLRRLRGRTVLGLLDGGGAPENVVHQVVTSAPKAVLIADAADFGARPGTCAFLGPERISGQTFSAHGMALSALIKFLGLSLPGCEIKVLGIQAAGLQTGRAGLSPEVELAVDELSGLLGNEEQTGA